MTRPARKYLEDIAAACTKITVYLSGRSEADFYSVDQLQSSVKWELYTVAEATVQLLKVEPAAEQQIRLAKEIIKFRVVLAHRYDKLDLATLWQIATIYVPSLKEDVDRMMGGT